MSTIDDTLPPGVAPPPLMAIGDLIHDDPYAPGTYVTDGEHLWRFLRTREPRGGWCAVEDCATLEITLVPIREVLAWDVRPVRCHATAGAA